MKTTFYYASHPSELFHLKDQCTVWLPEYLPINHAMWNDNQVIATCNMNYLFQAKERIVMGETNHNDVIWIMIKGKTATGHLFNQLGKIENFFRIA